MFEIFFVHYKQPAKQIVEDFTVDSKILNYQMFLIV